jgi:hypothetical protein
MLEACSGKWLRQIAEVCMAGAMLLAAPPAQAGACRVTDFTDRSMNSLNEVQRLSFVIQMTRTEYDRLKAAASDSANYYDLIAKSPSLIEARQAAQTKLEGLQVQNIDEYRKVWASDFLSDEQLQKLADCESSRQPGLALYGRSQDPSTFHLTYVHITPIGIEKIATRIVASANIANISDLEASLAELGPRDNYTARMFPLRLSDPAKPAVLVLRAGWETPRFVYIPVYPTPDYFK